MVYLDSDTESDASYISLFSETASEASEAESYISFTTIFRTFHETFEAELKNQFPNCPFNIDCFDDLLMLDYPFTEEPFILIYDDRLNYIQENYEVMDEVQKNTRRHYTIIKAKENKPITNRQILNAMINDGHYSSKTIQEQFGHYHLEKFERKSKMMFETCWGH